MFLAEHRRKQAKKQCSEQGIEAGKEEVFRAEHRRKQCSEHRSRQRSSIPSIEAGKEARNMGICAMKPIHVCSELQR